MKHVKCSIEQYDQKIKKAPFLTIKLDEVLVEEPDNDDGGIEFANNLIIACKNKGYTFRFYSSSKLEDFDYSVVVEPVIFEEKSTREQALEWWNNKFFNGTKQQYELGKKYYPNGFSDNMEYEIEEIWRKEMDRIDDEAIEEMEWDHESIKQNLVKSNQKQFKEFNSELFKAYINKFSDKDKREAFVILAKELNTSFE